MAEMFKDSMCMNDTFLSPDAKQFKPRLSAPHGKLFRVLGYQNGKPILDEVACNTVVVGGAITAMENLIGVNAAWRPSDLNSIHATESGPIGGTDAPTGVSPKLCLFGIGTGGSNLDFGSVIAPDCKQKDILNPIPLRYGDTIAAGTDSEKYFMKVPNSGATGFSWYLKEFEETPTIHTYWKNGVSADDAGTEITSDFPNLEDTRPIETYADITIKLNTNDGYEYFEKTGNLNSARYNTFGFYTGTFNPTTKEYYNVRLYSVITFNNKDLTIPNESTYLYRVYSLT